MTTKPRSIDQHNRFFALVSALFQQWPEKHSFQPDDEEHLRAWLLVKAKHRVIAEFCMSDATDEFARAIPVVAMAMFRKHCWAWRDGDSIKCCAAKSISIYGKDAVGHAEFCVINDNVDSVIRAETGLDPDRLMSHHAA